MVAQTIAQDTRSLRKAAWWRALSKAQRLGTTPAEVWAGYYAVASSKGGEYFVLRANDQATRYYCNCPAGQQDVPCYHAAATAAMPAEAAIRTAYREAHRAEQAPA
jgi:hypothetical protein